MNFENFECCAEQNKLYNNNKQETLHVASCSAIILYFYLDHIAIF